MEFVGLLQASAQVKHFEVSPQFNFITLLLKGKKQGFGKVIKMIDDMI